MWDALLGAEVDGSRICPCCGGENERKFAPQRDGNPYFYWCDSAKCRADQEFIRKRAALHGMTLEQYGEILERQGRRCPVCAEHLGKFNRNTVIDHDHEHCNRPYSCGECVRGILHRSCNSLISKLERDPDMFDRIREYLAS
ncbi:endonuclease domain-containing protein [Streptomyces melanogenes]|uniref:endonuclease domain-containing protein n=1 Tax=Streptomyces melanogenes TaxID=67326 RepID=UPI00167E0BD8|nr:hypothetical protein GCM10010278_63650 [Streptomyces melanogenes]